MCAMYVACVVLVLLRKAPRTIDVGSANKANAASPSLTCFRDTARHHVDEGTHIWQMSSNNSLREYLNIPLQ